jgi:hypothetical protein
MKVPAHVNLRSAASLQMDLSRTICRKLIGPSLAFLMVLLAPCLVTADEPGGVAPNALCGVTPAEVAQAIRDLDATQSQVDPATGLTISAFTIRQRAQALLACFGQAVLPELIQAFCNPLSLIQQLMVQSLISRLGGSAFTQLADAYSNNPQCSGQLAPLLQAIVPFGCGAQFFALLPANVYQEYTVNDAPTDIVQAIVDAASIAGAAGQEIDNRLISAELLFFTTTCGAANGVLSEVGTGFSPTGGFAWIECQC